MMDHQWDNRTNVQYAVLIQATLRYRNSVFTWTLFSPVTMESIGVSMCGERPDVSFETHFWSEEEEMGWH
jgi:hypothetical protein